MALYCMKCYYLLDCHLKPLWLICPYPQHGGLFLGVISMFSSTTSTKLDTSAGLYWHSGEPGLNLDS